MPIEQAHLKRMFNSEMDLETAGWVLRSQLPPHAAGLSHGHKDMEILQRQGAASTLRKLH
jgi:hypothetical protein